MQLKKENGNFHFDKGVITGCKQYSLSKTIEIEGKSHTIEIVKLKGYSQKKEKLTYNDMENMNKGVNKSQSQTQFICPKSNYISETDTFSIKSKTIKKSFRKTYTKGIILDNGDIEPLKI